jgi:hypothetical protein
MGADLKNAIALGWKKPRLPLATQLQSVGLTPLLHRTLPPNDGNIAFGQLACTR